MIGDNELYELLIQYEIEPLCLIGWLSIRPFQLTLGVTE